MEVFIDWFVSLGLIFGGCCSNVYTLERLVKASSDSGHLITFSQFILVAIDGFITHFDWKLMRLKPRKVPITQWMVLVILFFSTSILNNWAFSFQIPMTLHIIFRSSSIIVSMLLSFLFFNITYSPKEIIGVLLVSVGIVKSTLSSSTGNANGKGAEWNIGVGMLIMTVIIASLLGIVQQMTYTKYGRHWREGLFYTHFLALPLFLVFSKQIKQSAIEYSENGTWIYLVANVATQYVCVSGVTRLSSKCSSVTLNLVLTVRKFVSLLVSVVFFEHVFGVDSWIGALLVMGGTFIYSYQFKNESKKEKIK